MFADKDQGRNSDLAVVVIPPGERDIDLLQARAEGRVGDPPTTFEDSAGRSGGGESVIARCRTAIVVDQIRLRFELFHLVLRQMESDSKVVVGSLSSNDSNRAQGITHYDNDNDIHGDQDFVKGKSALPSKQIR
jgi:hypothetical protein